MKLTVIVGIITFLIGITGGMMLQGKLSKEPICPQPILNHKCNPSVEVQSLDLDRVRKIKGDFTYSPQFQGDVYMVSKTDTCK